jgi:antiviral helicase SKI2
MDSIALKLGQLQANCGMDITPEDYVFESINWGMMQVVYLWAQGKNFSDICLCTNVLEGSIVRCIMRLDETCHDVRNAARVIGDAALYEKMERASELIKRDIIFTASLWVT